MSRSNRTPQLARRRHAAIRAEIAEEEADAIEAEIAEKAGALEVPLHLRIDGDLDNQLRQRAAEVQIPTSALVRWLPLGAIQGQRRESPTLGEIEEIARRVAREEIAGC